MSETQTTQEEIMTVNITTTTRQVGSFSYNNQTTQISGPADYMTTRFQERMTKIYAGRDTVVNFGLGQGQEIISLVLVSLQTDYAAFLGMKNFNNTQEVKS